MKFEYEDFEHPRLKYRVTKAYFHDFHLGNLMKMGEEQHSVSDYIDCFISCMNIYSNYAWDGSTGVPDKDWSRRASAVHDAECQGMRLYIYEASLTNWQAAAREYRDNCIEDGLERKVRFIKTKARTRYLGIRFFGGNGYKFSKLLGIERHKK